LISGYVGPLFLTAAFIVAVTGSVQRIRVISGPSVGVGDPGGYSGETPGRGARSPN
jgi:hypothetical protein